MLTEPKGVLMCMIACFLSIPFLFYSAASSLSLLTSSPGDITDLPGKTPLLHVAALIVLHITVWLLILVYIILLLSDVAQWLSWCYC